MAGAVTIKRDVTQQLLKQLAALGSKRVLIGIPDTAADRKPEPGEKVTPSNALIGYVMETGSPAQNIPARPHLAPGVQAAEAQYVRMYQKGARAVLDGDAPNLDQVHEAVGLVASSSVKTFIDDGAGFAPLAPRTLAARRSRGRTGEKPLIDTGQYRRAITYVVRDRGQ